jgi:hypothetical protein
MNARTAEKSELKPKRTQNLIRTLLMKAMQCPVFSGFSMDRLLAYYLEHIIVYINLSKSLRGVLLVGQRSNPPPPNPPPSRA